MHRRVERTGARRDGPQASRQSGRQSGCRWARKSNSPPPPSYYIPAPPCASRRSQSSGVCHGCIPLDGICCSLQVDWSPGFSHCPFSTSDSPVSPKIYPGFPGSYADCLHPCNTTTGMGTPKEARTPPEDEDPARSCLLAFPTALGTFPLLREPVALTRPPSGLFGPSSTASSSGLSAASPWIA